eukprot:298539-Chlamydomonas_euryale.AAC.1
MACMTYENDGCMACMTYENDAGACVEGLCEGARVEELCVRGCCADGSGAENCALRVLVVRAQELPPTLSLLASESHKGESESHKGESESHTGESESHKGESESHKRASESHKGESESHKGEREGNT